MVYPPESEYWGEPVGDAVIQMMMKQSTSAIRSCSSYDINETIYRGSVIVDVVINTLLS
jgi:hypothetical protein